MGLTTLKIEIGNPANPEKLVTVEFLVDSGAVYSVVPARILKRLGIKPIATREFSLANGSFISRKKGIAFFKYGDQVGGADVIFGEPDDSTLLGATTLEALGMVMDPMKRRLLPLPLVLG